MVKIKVEYLGYSLEPPFNYDSLKTEYIEKETLDDAVMYLYEVANWNEKSVTYDNGCFSLYLNLGNIDNLGDVVTANYELKE